MAITDWPAHERPREKLLHQGPHALSDAELLAIFLRTGVKGKTAVDVARGLMGEFGSLRELLKADQKTFCKAEGLGEAKFVQLQAVLEMSRRHLRESLKKESQFHNAAEVRDYLTSHMRDYEQEVFACLFLDNKHRLIRFEELFFGTINQAAVHPREVVKKALGYNASAIILAHNHPSGDHAPSQADIMITEQLKQALALVDVRVLDHFIVGEGAAYSLAENGQL
jgi:DNA repair protein RadC